MVHPVVLDRRSPGGLTCHVAALSPVVADADTETESESDAKPNRLANTVFDLFVTPISVAGMGAGWLNGAASTAVRGTPVDPVAATAERMSTMSQARVRALQELFTWVDSQPPVPFVPLDAMDRGNLY